MQAAHHIQLGREPRPALAQRRLGLLERGDIEECRDDAIDLMLARCAVGREADDVHLSRMARDFAFDWRHRRQDAPGILFEVVVQRVLQVGNRTIEVARSDLEDVAKLRCEALDADVWRQKQRRHVRGGHQVLEIAVPARDLFEFELQLLIDRVQLFVAALQLLLARFQLLGRGAVSSFRLCSSSLAARKSSVTR